MPHEIDYSNAASPAEKRERALNDVLGFLGEKNFNAIAAEIARTPVAERDYKTACGLAFQLEMFAGVSGYPVAAWIASLWNLSDDEVIKMMEQCYAEADEKCS